MEANTAPIWTEAESFRGGSLGYVVFKRTYAARLTNTYPACSNPTPTLESFEQCIQRMMESDLIEKVCNFSDNDRYLLQKFLLEQKCSLSGRCLQTLGIPDDENGNLHHRFLPLTSCAFVDVSDSVRPFIFAAMLSLMGVGVGYSVERKYVGKLPQVCEIHPERLTSENEHEDEAIDFIVPDSRRGWITLFEKLLSAYFGIGHPVLKGRRFVYSLELVCASGSHQDILGLETAVQNVARVLGARAGKGARSVDCMDVMNIIVTAVVQSRTRRAALLAIGDPDDMDLMKAKRWDLGEIPLWRSASNNSVACGNIEHLPPEFWEGYRGNGEALGLVNLDLFRSCGRTGEAKHPDPHLRGVSACAEQGLADQEVSCLAELMLPHFDSPEDLWEATRLVYTVCKNTFLLHNDEEDERDLFCKTIQATQQNFRLGIGVTGYMQASEKQKSWLSANYERLRAYDVTYSEQQNLPCSIRLTTVKPSGTVSLLSGNTPGCHPGFARHFIRRIRFNANSPLIQECRQMGLFVEPERGFDGKPTGRQVVEFPCTLSKGTQLAEDTSAVQQLEVVRRLQSEWSDSAVSVTVYYTLDELEEIQNWLKKHYHSNIKACSFMLHSEHGFDQAPYEKVSGPPETCEEKKN